jgi:hypothetical protein
VTRLGPHAPVPPLRAAKPKRAASAGEVGRRFLLAVTISTIIAIAYGPLIARWLP